MQGRYAVGGIVAGLVGALAMAIYTMTNEFLSGHSIFTPMYMPATPLVGMGPMERGMGGGALYLEPFPAILGMVVHFLWAAFWGLLFAAVLWLTRATGWAGFGLGIVWGYVAGTIMSALVLPAVGMGPMWEQPGLMVFALDHLAFGLPLALWALLFVRAGSGESAGRLRHAA
jgi:hypothetical protein